MLPAVPLARILNAGGNPIGGAKALGINDAGDLVGYAYDQGVPPTVCVENATMWAAPNETLIVLGNQSPLGLRLLAATAAWPAGRRRRG